MRVPCADLRYRRDTVRHWRGGSNRRRESWRNCCGTIGACGDAASAGHHTVHPRRGTGRWPVSPARVGIIANNDGGILTSNDGVHPIVAHALRSISEQPLGTLGKARPE